MFAVYLNIKYYSYNASIKFQIILHAVKFKVRSYQWMVESKFL